MIIINAFFVAAEMAFARIRHTRIEQLAEEGNKAALLAQRSLSNPDKFISAGQLGITLSTLALGAVGERVFASEMVKFLIDSGISTNWSVALLSAAKATCYVFAFSFTAFLQTIFGELVPKTLSFQRAEPILLSTIYIMDLWQFLISPLISFLNVFTTLTLRLMNIKEPPRHHYVHSEEELKMLVSASHEEGVLQEDEQEMLHSVFDFSDTVASQVMVPRIDMICIKSDKPTKEFVDLALEHGHSRIPVYDDNIDSIIGFVHISDGLRSLIKERGNMPVKELVHQILIVPENKNIGVLLSEF